MKSIIFSLVSIITLWSSNASAQIGIGTITPRGALEISSATNGFIPPQVALTATNVSAPVVDPQTAGAPIAGTFIYNTATAGAGATAVSPGYYYWTGAIWQRLASSDWTLTGNSGTVAGTNFLGTTDATDIRIKTNSTDRWNISHANSGQLQSYSLGTAALPIYSFQGDQNTGIFSPAADFLGASTAGTERMRIESDGDIGIGTTTPSNHLHVVHDANGAGVMRLDNGTAGGFAGTYFYQGANYRGHIGYVNTGGLSTFGGKGAYQLASGNRPITFSADPTELYLERMVIATDGRVGINTNPTNIAPTVQPTSTLQVNGSLALGLVRVTIGNGATYNVPNDISKLIINTNSSSSCTVVLPDPSTCTGRTISISRGDTGTKVVTVQGATGTIQSLGGALGASTTIPTGATNIVFWSDGTDWYR